MITGGYEVVTDSYTWLRVVMLGYVWLLMVTGGNWWLWGGHAWLPVVLSG